MRLRLRARAGRAGIGFGCMPAKFATAGCARRGWMRNWLRPRLARAAITARTATFAARLPGAAAEFSPDLIVGFNKMPGLDVYYAADAAFAVKRSARGFLYRMTPRCRQHFAFEKAVFGRESETEILMISRAQIAVHQHFYDTPDARMTLLPPGISREHIIGAGEDAAARRAAFRAELGIADTDKALLALGSGFRIKGLERTLRGLAALPPALAARTHLWVVGEDNAAPFERLARKLGVGARVRFFGGRDDAPEFLLGADVLAHPAHLETAGQGDFGGDGLRVAGAGQRRLRVCELCARGGHGRGDCVSVFAAGVQLKVARTFGIRARGVARARAGVCARRGHLRHAAACAAAD